MSSPKKWVLRPKATTIRGVVAKKWRFRHKTTTRTGLVAKKVGSPSKSDDENGSRRQKVEVPVQKRRREWLSSPKNSIFGLKTTTRTSLVAKKWRFPHKNDDEKGCRRQKIAFSVSKRRRERVSSPKKEVFRLKKTTRKGIVAKK